MAYVKADTWVLQQIATTGLPLVGGVLYAYVWDTSTPLAMYTNSAGSGSATSFTLNSLGMPQSSGGTAVDIYLDDAYVYKFILRDSDGVAIGPTIGPVYPGGGNGLTGTMTSMEALRASSVSFDYIETLAFYEDGSTGAAKLYRDGTGTPTGSGAAVIAAALAAGTFCNAAGVCYKLRIDQRITPYMFGAAGDGSTDDSDAIIAAWTFAPAGELYFPAGEYKITKECVFASKNQISIEGERGAQITVVDGNYAGFHLTSSSQRCTVDGLVFRGTETMAPICTLLKFSGLAAYGIVKYCDFAYASKAVVVNGIYIHKMLGNSYSNCDTYFFTETNGSVDVLLDGETYGTTNIGASPVIDIQKASFVRFDSCYWETQNTAKNKASCYVSGNVGNVSFANCQGDDSGGFEFAATTTVNWLGGVLRNCYTDYGSFCACIRGSGLSSQLIAMGLAIKISPAPGDQCSGILTISDAILTGNYIRVASGIGINLAGSPVNVVGNFITGCETGLKTQATLTHAVAGLNYFSSNTLDIEDGFGESLMVANYAATVTELSAGGYFANVPKRSAATLRTSKGITANRPTLTAADVGYMYIDETLAANGKPIWWAGTMWVDKDGVAV